MKKITSIIFSMLIFTSIGIVYGMDYQEEWARIYGNIYSNDGSSMAIDNKNNIIIAGCSTTEGKNNIQILKYDTNGNIVWQREFKENDNETTPSGLAIDSQDNILITGWCRYPGGGHEDFITIKYDPNGNVLWYKTYNKNVWDTSRAICIDYRDNIIISGYSDDPAGPNDIVYCITIKYDPLGNILVGWPQLYHATGPFANTITPLPNRIVIDSNNNILILGNTVSGPNGVDFTIMKYSPNGPLEWIRTFSGVNDRPDQSKDMKIDSKNNIIVTGSSENIEWNNDFLTIKYDPNGNIIWINRYGEESGMNESPYSLAIDSFDNIYVTGEAKNELNNNDFLTIKYDSSGNVIWPKKYNGSGNYEDIPQDIIVDEQNNIIVSGSTYFSEECSYNESNHSYECKKIPGLHTIAYSVNGDILWERSKKTSSVPYRCIIAKDSNYNLILNAFYSLFIQNQYMPQNLTIKYKKISPQNNLPINSIMNIINNNLEEED